jgi:protein SCO1/2
VIWLNWAVKPRYFLFWLHTVTSLTLAPAMLWAARTEAHDHPKAEGVNTQQIRARPIPDVRLTDQNGRQVQFTSDVLRQGPALISFIYTSCTTTCPLVGATVAAVTEHLEADFADLAIISISIDPEYDTPGRLLAWREQYGELPRWTLLTGPKRDIKELLRAFGAYSPNLEEHSEILLVGPNAAGQWTRMSSLAAWDKVAAVIRTATGHGHGE